MKKLTACLLLLLWVAGATGCTQREYAVPEEPMRSESSADPASDPEDTVQQEEPSQDDESSEEEKEAGEAEAAVVQAMTALQSGNRDTIRSHLDYKNLLQLQEGQPDTNHLALLRRMTFAVEEVQVNGTNAVATVRVGNVDMKTVLPDYIKAAGELEYHNALSETPRSQEELEAEYTGLFEKCLDAGSSGKIERTVEIALLNSGGKWKAQVNEELRNTALGDYFIAQSRNSAGGGMDGL